MRVGANGGEDPFPGSRDLSLNATVAVKEVVYPDVTRGEMSIVKKR